MCHEKLAPGFAYYSESAENARLAGQNAARLVKGMPLKFEAVKKEREEGI
ncbi:hypothetical protein JQN58_14640 [Aneurinibacillus sp. BA2021]|nr:hypothetical protein [Aneurinibacillus sp. BA2021]